MHTYDEEEEEEEVVGVTAPVVDGAPMQRGRAGAPHPKAAKPSQCPYPQKSHWATKSWSNFVAILHCFNVNKIKGP